MSSSGDQKVVYIAGYLRKQNPFLPTWKRRWFTLTKEGMKYYETKDDEKNGVEPKGIIKLSQISEFYTENTAGWVLVTPSREFHLEADSKERARDWIIQLQSSLNPGLSSERHLIVSTVNIRRVSQHTAVPNKITTDAPSRPQVDPTSAEPNRRRNSVRSMNPTRQDRRKSQPRGKLLDVRQANMKPYSTVKVVRGRTRSSNSLESSYQLKGEKFHWQREMVDFIPNLNASEQNRRSHEGVLYLSSFRILFLPDPHMGFLEEMPIDYQYESWLLENNCNSSIPSTIFPRLPNCHAFIQIPLLSIIKLEEITKKSSKGLKNKCVEITTSYGRQVVFSFRSCVSERDQFVIQLKQALPQSIAQVFASTLSSEIQLPQLQNFIPYNFDAEFCSWVDLKSTEVLWRVSTDNIEYEVCPTYPGRLIVPASIDDSILRKSASFRMYQRFPVISWIYREKAAALIRSSLPTNERCVEDEELIKAYALANPNSNILFIFDVHSKALGISQVARGVSIENSNFYPDVKLKHLDLPSVGDIKESWQKFLSVISDPSSSSWYSALDHSKWFHSIRDLINGSSKIVTLMHQKGNSVLIHDRSGWDQTPQLTSLVQLLLSPKARTIQGFCNLIEREWLSFGYPFATTNGHYYQSESNDSRFISSSSSFKKDLNSISPLFIQFLDCVWQLLQKYPQHFDFNEEFLVTMALASYEGLFATFIGNSEQERIRHQVIPHTAAKSLWVYIFCNLTRYRNPYFRHDELPIIPHVEVSDIHVWSAFYYRWNRFAHHRVTSNLDNIHQFLLNENFELRKRIQELSNGKNFK